MSACRWLWNWRMPDSLSPQPLGRRVRLASGRTDRTGVPARLRAGTQPRRASLGSLEASPIAEPLPQRSVAAERRGSPYSSQAAPPSTFDHRVLETGFFVRLDIRYIMRDSVMPI